MQAKRLAYTDLLRYNGDPRFVHIPLKGYKVRNVPGNDDVFGGYQAILFQAAPGLKAPPEWVTRGDPPVNGVCHGGSDFRKDGEAVGW